MFLAPLLAQAAPFKWLIIAGTAVALLGGSYIKGRTDSTANWRAAEMKQQLAQAKKRFELQQQVDALAEKLETARGKREVVVKTILKEVPRYVKEPPAQCADSGLHASGFRVLYDAAAAGVVPDPASVAAAAPVQATTAAPAIIADLVGCNENARKIEGWLDFWATVPKPPSTP